MAKLYDISNWNEQSWWNTGGTRDKKIYLNPADNELYYFKQSFKKGQRDYKHEFWSEIIASEIGIMLGFNVLEYNIAIRGKITGCISKSMINQTSEELIEGGKYLQAFDNTFNPENVKLRNQYNFELIVNALTSFQKENHLKDLVETIIFDALIGNSDRHQENWAIINVHSVFSEVVKQFEQDVKTGVIETLPNWLKAILKKGFLTDKGEIRSEIQGVRLGLPKQTRFAPIYDSGCSFGRELETERVLNMLDDEAEIEKYLDKGVSEIHWESKKISHFDLLDKLLQRQEFKEIIITLLEKIVANFNIGKIENVVFNIDNDLMIIDNHNVLPKERKELIVKLLTLRFKRLKEIYSQNK
jgi:hypothetical protein